MKTPPTLLEWPAGLPEAAALLISAAVAVAVVAVEAVVEVAVAAAVEVAPPVSAPAALAPAVVAVEVLLVEVQLEGLAEAVPRVVVPQVAVWLAQAPETGCEPTAGALALVELARETIRRLLH